MNSQAQSSVPKMASYNPGPNWRYPNMWSLVGFAVRVSIPGPFRCPFGLLSMSAKIAQPKDPVDVGSLLSFPY
ncbi:hypothetical protein SJAG_00658 [Schizosaccharomyces japonicus yFS275]|uniref:Uncharacterized protein n=1 Tax=Schizosaccharomyces japonicus (strain yFS275 / FY16936) TaxID=402676 RepID=B6JW86_SCHJY|nr:hypothetical protein SJAG_00658 [Schizosaccharomyces japonicus yFS275]EEB05637.1 hypothetical protein SJAG_00658 [Schizosaccharomyces japonicus yFS275]